MAGCFTAIAAFCGLIVVGLLAIFEAIVRAISPGFSLPFSPWWGMIFSLPALGMTWIVLREEC